LKNHLCLKGSVAIGCWEMLNVKLMNYYSIQREPL
jgi:hypothetical protein